MGAGMNRQTHTDAHTHTRTAIHWRAAVSI